MVLPGGFTWEENDRRNRKSLQNAAQRCLGGQATITGSMILYRELNSGPAHYVFIIDRFSRNREEEEEEENEQH